MRQGDRVLSALLNSSLWTRLFQGYTEGYVFDATALHLLTIAAICRIHETMSVFLHIMFMIDVANGYSDIRLRPHWSL
jgi:hypothetical protein